jgi:thiamine biosynthesis lipoprotein
VIERRREVGCFGGRVAVAASGPDAAREEIDSALALAAARLLWIHSRLTRFSPSSELSLLNADPRAEVPASRLVLNLADAVTWAGELSGGLVDATCIDALETTGYSASIEPHAEPRPHAVAPARPRPAVPDPAALWRHVSVDPAAGTVRRPAGIRIDSGGIGKGLAADLIAASLAGLDSYSVDCAGDLRIGGASALERLVLVRDPWDGGSVAELHVADGAVATSGITARAWRDASGRPGHHLIDPGRGTSAWTGVAQATALAPTALEAEVLAKAALLAGPAAGPARLVHGGVLVLDEGKLIEVAAPRVEAAAA